MKDARDGKRPLYRPRNWKREERSQAKKRKKHRWYGEKHDAVYFVQSTPSGQLAAECRQVFKKSKLKVKVVERSGTSMKRLLTKSNPFQTAKCSHPTCCVCKNSSSRMPICQVRDCVYQIKCGQCGYTYVGETARSLRERMEEHFSLLQNKSKKSVLYQHVVEKHEDGGAVTWDISLRSRCPQDATLRQATEATIINLEDPQLNRKAEFGGHQNKSRPRVERTNRWLTAGWHLWPNFL